MKTIKNFFAGVGVAVLVLLPGFAQADTQVTLSVSKQVRNVTTGPSTWADVVNAKSNDYIEHEIKIKNIGSSTATNVMVSDGLSQPSYTSGRSNIYISRAYTGSLGDSSGLTFSSLESGGEIVIRYQTQVLSTSQLVTLCNIAAVRASNAAQVSRTACTHVNNVNVSSTTLSADFQVRNITQGIGFGNTVNARGGDVVEYQLKLKNTGTSTAQQVSVSDSVSATGYVGAKSNYTVSRSYSGNLDGANTITFGSVESGGEITITYRATVNSYNQNNTPTVCANATAVAANASLVTDNACIVVYANILSGSTSTLSYSLKAWNDTKNKDATQGSASREDFITYTLTVKNTGSSDATGIVISTGLAGVLPLADMIDAGGGTVAGDAITYLAVNVPSGGEVSKKFRVRVKYHLTSNISYTMSTTYGNTISVAIAPLGRTTTYVAPNTGSNQGTLGALLTGLVASFGFAAVTNRRFRQLVLASKK